MDESQYLIAIITPLIEYPQDLQISKRQDDKGTLLSIRVADLDMGRLIGREGKHAGIIRDLMRVFGALHQMRIQLKIEEPVAPQNVKKHSHESDDIDAEIKSF